MPDRKITDKALRKAFKRARQISFAARNFSSTRMDVRFGSLRTFVSLERVLELAGITPQMLRPVFHEEGKRNSLPKRVTSYKKLGNFPLAKERFWKLAKILGKTIHVFQANGQDYELIYLFSIDPRFIYS